MLRRKEIALVTAGILAGITVSGPAAQAAAGLVANPSSQRFYVNEQRVNLEAYEIGGSNYVRLRDIGQAVGFGVTYDAATNTVTISPDKPYEMTATVPAISQPTLSKNTDGSINIPQDGSQYVPQAGNVIRCDDGTNYTITDVSRYDKNYFADGPVGPLPNTSLFDAAHSKSNIKTNDSCRYNTVFCLWQFIHPFYLIDAITLI